MRQIIDGIPYELQKPFNLRFLKRFGRVFRVFDDQDSGNLCFGVEKNGVRTFVKLAGAQTMRGSVSPETAVANLRATLSLYRSLRHENLISLKDAFNVPGGFAMAFDWVDGECMGRAYPESRAKFMVMDMKERLNAFDGILSFFLHTTQQDFVAIDFYDGSILYDFNARRTVICDIDYVRRAPAVNDMGRMWGSSRFMSPEEFELGAPLDQITNVYTLGATAFALFADYRRERERWPLNDALYHVAARAVSPDRSDRQQSIHQFIMEWNAAR